MIKTILLFLPHQDLSVFVRMKNSLLKRKQVVLQLESVNKSGCSKENELAASVISSSGLQILHPDNNTGSGY